MNSETQDKGRKVKHRLNGRVGIIIGVTHYAYREKRGEFEVRWLNEDGLLIAGHVHRCEVKFVEDDE